MRHTALMLVLPSLIVLAPAAARGADKVTLDSLLRQMTDLSGLAEFPAPAFIARQSSSYDQGSESPRDPKGWFANADRGFMLYDGIVADKTPYFTSGPMQGRPPDGYFPAGTR